MVFRQCDARFLGLGARRNISHGWGGNSILVYFHNQQRPQNHNLCRRYATDQGLISIVINRVAELDFAVYGIVLEADGSASAQ
jgi:hypothetical protein